MVSTSSTKLSDFIKANTGPILDEWEQFANAIPAGRQLDMAGLRDHAAGMLQAIAADLQSEQTAQQQALKARGKSIAPHVVSQAELHGASRVKAGFSVVEEVSEFRALRASVLRLWTLANPAAVARDSEDLIRFNEAIDQALSESITRYSRDSERNSRLFHKLLSSSLDLSYIFDEQGRFVYANAALTSLLGCSLEEIVGKRLSDLDKHFEPVFAEDLHRATETREVCRGETTCTLQGGSAATYEYFLVPVLARDGEFDGVTGTARDVTQRTISEQNSRRSANYDSLTGLPNRNLFRERLDWEIKRSERTGLPIAVLFIDLDGFKQVNDRLGHAAGDQLLQQAARRISASVRATDTVARFGGDEFTVIVAVVKRTRSVETLAAKLLKELAKPFSVLQQEASVSASIGIALFPHDAQTPDSLLRNADQAMYMAKHGGRNRFCFSTSDLRDSVWERLRTSDELREALRKHQLSVHYQPIVDLASNQIVKAEALLRWRHPKAGLLLPETFVGIAEESGLIGEIDNWVVHQAAGRARAWSALCGTPFQVCVNTSTLDFSGEEPLDLPGKGVAVEITESVLLSDSPRVAENLGNLHKAGVDLIIDDFGIGYSSLVDLKKFAIASLKINPSLVASLKTDADAPVIAEAMICMAHRLGLTVVAEGVETVEQWDWLKAASCDFAQGYLISAPVTAEAFGKLLRPRATPSARSAS